VAAFGRFAARFRAELDSLRGSLGPLAPGTDPSRHAALLLHRAMFRRFLQDAGFDQDGVASAPWLDGFSWRLDDSAAADALTPDVFGSLFDKHVSRRETGTYYTRRDVSEYIARATVVPAFLDTITASTPGFLGAAAGSGLVDDLITRNVDPIAYAVAAIGRCDDPRVLRVAWQALTGLTVLDPTCGCGEFLVAALRVLERIYEACLSRMAALCDPADSPVLARVRRRANLRHFVRATILRRNVYGVDLMPEAAEITRMRLLLMLAAVAGTSHSVTSQDLGGRVRPGDILAGPDPFSRLTRQRGFSVVLGNPPYVELRAAAAATAPRRYRTASCGNQYALVLERSLGLLAGDGRLGMIVPHSAVCTDRMAPLLGLLTTGATTWVSSYDIRPCKLFPAVDQRLAIILRRAAPETRMYSTRYHRWHEPERPALFRQLRYLDVSDLRYPNSIPKAGDPIEKRIWCKLHAFAPLAADLGGGSVVYYHNAPRYWVRAMTFAPYFWNERDGEKLSAQVKTLPVRDAADAWVVAAALNSSLFCWWWLLLSDCRHLNRREIDRFPAGLAVMSAGRKRELGQLCRRLMAAYRRHAIRKVCRYRTTGKVAYDEFYPGRSKSILDEIDRVLAAHYGFGDEDWEYIVKFDLKYRMGRE
jgi:hypothetical protein